MSTSTYTNRRTWIRLSAGAASLLSAAIGRRVWCGPLASDNPSIQKPRQIALELLKPSERDLRHGLQLHEESLVFESYGFAPRAAIDGDQYRQAIESGASDDELVDLREEMTMTRCATNDVERHEFLDAMRSVGVTCIFENCGEEGNDPLRLLKRLARYQFTVDQMAPDLTKAIRPSDVVAAKAAGRFCLAFTTNGVPLRQQWIDQRDELRHVKLFRQMGVRMMHLTYNRRNPLGDGAGEANDAGLSDFGKTAIQELNRLGIIVDVAHSGWRTSLEAAKASKRPMVASHSACASLHKHYRGKPDDTIKAICDTGGVIGICCIPRFLGGNGDITAFLDHIDYAIKKFGADHVAIGTDVAYVSRNESVERAKLPKRTNGNSFMSNRPSRWEHLWPADDFRASADATASLSWVNWPLFTVGMVQRGHADETIRKVLGQNVLRVWEANES